MSDQNTNHPKIEHPRTEGDVAAELRADLSDPSVDLATAASTDPLDTEPLSKTPQPTKIYPQTEADRDWLGSQDSAEQDEAWRRASQRPVSYSGAKEKREGNSRIKKAAKTIGRVTGEWVEKGLGGDGGPAKWQ